MSACTLRLKLQVVYYPVLFVKVGYFNNGSRLCTLSLFYVGIFILNWKGNV